MGYHALKPLSYLVRRPQALKRIREEEQMGYHALKPLGYLVRRPQALKRIREEEPMGITHGNLLHTYKRECR
jgi:hypothetical protein